MKMVLKKRPILSWALAAVMGIFASCSNHEVTPETPQSEYVKLRFTTGEEIAGKAAARAVWNDTEGSGNLLFNWEQDLQGTELIAALCTDDALIPTQDGARTMQIDNYYSYLTIAPITDSDGISKRAEFETVKYYLADDIAQAEYVHAVTPVKGGNLAYSLDNMLQVFLWMPNTFAQTESQNPEFLRDHMMMYGSAAMTGSSSSIQFQHIPATFRFIITNKRSTEANITGIKMKMDDETSSVGSSKVEVSTSSDDIKKLDLKFSGYHKTITTTFDAQLAKDGVFTAYTMALPESSDNNAFEGKKILFNILTAENEPLAFALDAATLANANPNGEYNWVGGKSYTIRMSLDDVLTFEGITVTDWNEKDPLDAGEAADKTAPQLNSEGEYEVRNAPNLLWVAQQINARTIAIPYKIKLTDNITIDEDMEWIPINHPDGASYSSVFDGNGHTLTINQNRPEATDDKFGLFNSFNYSTVKNLVLKGNVTVNTSSPVGAVAGSGYRTTISRVVSYVNITNTGSGRTGGLVGQFGGQHSNGLYSLIENCAVYANISGSVAGGIVGYGWSGWQYYDIKNTAFCGDVTGTANQGAIIGYHANNQTADMCIFQHIYYCEKDALAFSGGGNTNYTLGSDVAAKTAADFKAASMADLLNTGQENGPWEYLTGNDYPTLKK